MGEVIAADFNRARESRQRRTSRNYQSVDNIIGEEEHLLGLTMVIFIEPLQLTIRELERKANNYTVNNEQSPVGWYSKASVALLQGVHEDAFEYFMEAYHRREVLPEISSLCISVLNTLELNEAVRDVTEIFLKEAIKEDPLDKRVYKHLEFAANRIGYETFDEEIAREKWRRFNPQGTDHRQP